MSFVDTYRSQVLQAIDAINLKQVEQAIEWFREARAAKRMIFVAGNGGSAATASHFVCDLVKDVSYQRDLRFRAMALQDAIPTATAYSNDVDFTEGIAETLRNFAQPGVLSLDLPQPLHLVQFQPAELLPPAIVRYFRNPYRSHRFSDRLAL